MDTLSYSIKVRELGHLQYVPWLRLFKFQQDMLASLIRFLREKLAQQKEILLRVKQEREELKSLRKCARPMLRAVDS